MRPWILLTALLAGCAVTPNYLDLRSTTVKVSDEFGHGSGTVVAPNLVLTAAHVVRDHPALELEFPDGRTVAAAVQWIDDVSDAALLRLEKPEKQMAAIDCKPLQLGERVFTFGNPGFLRFVLTEGIVAGTDSLGAQKPFLPNGMPLEIEPMLVVSADWEPGDSGSAVFDHRGHIRGVVSIVFSIDGSRTNNALITPVTVLPACKGK